MDLSCFSVLHGGCGNSDCRPLRGGGWHDLGVRGNVEPRGAAAGRRNLQGTKLARLFRYDRRTLDRARKLRRQLLGLRGQKQPDTRPALRCSDRGPHNTWNRHPAIGQLPLVNCTATNVMGTSSELPARTRPSVGGGLRCATPVGASGGGVLFPPASHATLAGANEAAASCLLLCGTSASVGIKWRDTCVACHFPCVGALMGRCR